MIKVGTHYFDETKIFHMSKLETSQDKSIGSINLQTIIFKKDIADCKLYEESIKEYNDMLKRWAGLNES